MKDLRSLVFVAGLMLLPACCCQDECDAPAKKTEKKAAPVKKSAPKKKAAPTKKAATKKKAAPAKKAAPKKDDKNKKTSYARELTVEYGEDLALQHVA